MPPTLPASTLDAVLGHPGHTNANWSARYPTLDPTVLASPDGVLVDGMRL